MRFLTNENIPDQVVLQLRLLGHDVLSAKESLRGADDEVILARAQGEHRVLLTQDKDFGELAYRAGLPISSGVVLFRLRGADPQTVSCRMIAVLPSSTPWPGMFSVVDDRRVRSRPLPLAAGPDA